MKIQKRKLVQLPDLIITRKEFPGRYLNKEDYLIVAERDNLELIFIGNNNQRILQTYENLFVR